MDTMLSPTSACLHLARSWICSSQAWEAWARGTREPDPCSAELPAQFISHRLGSSVL